MADKQGKSNEKGIFSRTATYTSKRARRAQEKFMQKVGKSDETKDEVFDEFVSNFSKQQSAVTRLQKELKQYLQCVASMQVASNAFAEAVKEIYEPDWHGKDTIIELYEELDANFNTLNRRLTDEVLEPIDAYHRPFADVKTKISKRGRKRVDYDHCRHVVDTLRAKGTAKSADAKKLSQAEEEYQKAKNVFVELTSELYDELPALYDARIGFYVACFQTVFTLEGVFHRECAKIQNQLNDLMDQLIKDVSSGTYSTKKSFPVAREDDQEITPIDAITAKASEGGLATFYDVAVPDEDEEELEATPSLVNGETKPELDLEEGKKPVLPPTPARPAPQRPIGLSASKDASDASDKQNDKESASSEDAVARRTPDNDDTPASDNDAGSIETLNASQELVAYKNPEPAEGPNRCHLLVPQSIYKVIATHPYAAEDEDELSFEKDEIIHVVEFDDPEEQDEGWLMGILDANGLKGVFPENFTKKFET